MIMPDGTIYEEKLPECKTNYYNSVGLRFQAEAVRQAISNGKYLFACLLIKIDLEILII